MEQPNMSPSMDALLKIAYTPKDWVQYYKNIWTRNAVARSIDIETDKILKAKNPEDMVQSDDGRMIPVKERLENRKIALQDALEIIAAADALIALSEEELKAKWSPEALKVDQDMMPQPIKAGDKCTTADGKAGTWQDDGKGQLLCIPDEVAPAEDKGEASPEAKV